MRRTLALGALLLATPALAVETMRIHVGDFPSEVVVAGEGLVFGPDQEDAALVPAPARRSVIRAGSSALVIDGTPWPDPSVRFRAPAGLLSASGKELRGDVVVRLNGGALQIINVLALEDYLAGVLGSEMPLTFPDEALKAQAVAARTYALHKKLEAFDQPFHLGSSVLHQVYGGLAREDPRTRAAVEATRGLILTWALQPAETYFHAACGGRTEGGSVALGRPLPYLVSVDCPCGAAGIGRWSATLAAADVASAVNAPRAGPVSVDARGRTGRVERVRVGDWTVDAVTFRQRLGYSRVKSLSFDVRGTGAGDVHLVGQGYGHGAGMCQWGAKILAERGRTFREILEHYYPGTELEALY